MKKSTIIRITAVEYLMIFLLSIAAVDAFNCNPVFVLSMAISIAWYVIFFIANGIIN